MDRVSRLLEWNTTDGFGDDEADGPGFGLTDLTPVERAEYRRRLKDLRQHAEAGRDVRRDVGEVGMTIHGPGYHDEPYCGGY